MMSGPLPAVTAAAVLVCSWSAVMRSTATVTPYFWPNSLHWRTNSVSAAGTKCTHCRRRMEAPCLALGSLAAAGPGVLWLPPHASSSGPAARPAAARPVAVRNFRRVHGTQRRRSGSTS